MSPVDRQDHHARLRATLAAIAPGTALRDGLERILRGRTGALIVMGHDKVVKAMATGGFDLDVPFTATGLRELAKMDGAIILSANADKILRAVAMDYAPSREALSSTLKGIDSSAGSILSRIRD